MAVTSKPWLPVETDQSAEWHRERFVEFVGYKQDVGEPSPHMTLAGWLCQDPDDPVALEEVIWRAGLYGAPYSVLTSEAIWSFWPWEDASEEPSALAEWVRANWAGFHIRTERRMVREPSRMNACLRSWLEWCQSREPRRLLAVQDLMSPKEAYDAWYASVEQVMYFGRYITIRVVEFLRRYAGAKAELYDVRSIGGESPVRCLALLYPEWEYRLLERKEAGMADALAEDLLGMIQAVLPQVGHYVLAAMLCEYRVAYENRGQYPGRTIDQELEYLNGPKGAYWADKYDTALWAAREAVVPHAALGEKHGWAGIRHDLSRWLRDKGEVWSDTKYDYMEAKA
jgi:hypothetical protein